MGFAQTDTDVLVRIGIKYSAAGAKDYTADFMSGLSMNTVTSGKLKTLGSFTSESQLLFQRNTKYAVAAIQGFGSKDEADLLLNVRNFQPLGYYFSGNVRPILAICDSKSEATSRLNDFAGQFPDLSLGVIDPQINQIQAKGFATSFIYTDQVPLVFMSGVDAPFYKIVGKLYRGGLTVHGLGNKETLSHINVQNLDTYLYGVLPKEMAYNWPVEALKAQAVAARNFAIQSLNKHKAFGFDMCTTVDCQVYGGVESEKPESTQAVEATKGMLIYFNGLPISAFYHSNSGGVTENSENVWTAVLNYIRGTQDQYSLGAPHSDWMLSYTKEELQSALLKSGFDVGLIYDIRINKKTAAGRVNSVTVVGAKGTFVFEKEKFRTALGTTVLKSMLFDIQKGDKIAVLSKNGQQAVAGAGLYALSANGLKALQMPMASYNGYTTTLKSTGAKDFTFVGHGYGHGLGMSQYGAKKMAELGYNYIDILSFYYNGVVIQ
jgi:stage II sporulation protein D